MFAARGRFIPRSSVLSTDLISSFNNHNYQSSHLKNMMVMNFGANNVTLRHIPLNVTITRSYNAKTVRKGKVKLDNINKVINKPKTSKEIADNIAKMAKKEASNKVLHDVFDPDFKQQFRGMKFTSIPVKSLPYITFTSMGVASHIWPRLHETNIRQPTAIQLAALPHLLPIKAHDRSYVPNNSQVNSSNYREHSSVQFPSLYDVIIQDMTGSGKSLAYIVPLLQSIDLRSNTLQAIIVQPTRELCVQVYRQITQLADLSEIAFGKVNVSRCNGNVNEDMLRSFKNKPPHILVTTPRTLTALLNSVTADDKATLLKRKGGKSARALRRQEERDMTDLSAPTSTDKKRKGKGEQEDENYFVIKEEDEEAFSKMKTPEDRLNLIREIQLRKEMEKKVKKGEIDSKAYLDATGKKVSRDVIVMKQVDKEIGGGLTITRDEMLEVEPVVEEGKKMKKKKKNKENMLGTAVEVDYADNPYFYQKNTEAEAENVEEMDDLEEFDEQEALRAVEKMMEAKRSSNVRVANDNDDQYDLNVFDDMELEDDIDLKLDAALDNEVDESEFNSDLDLDTDFDSDLDLQTDFENDLDMMDNPEDVENFKVFANRDNIEETSDMDIDAYEMVHNDAEEVDTGLTDSELESLMAMDMKAYMENDVDDDSDFDPISDLESGSGSDGVGSDGVGRGIRVDDLTDHELDEILDEYHNKTVIDFDDETNIEVSVVKDPESFVPIDDFDQKQEKTKKYHNPKLSARQQHKDAANNAYFDGINIKKRQNIKFLLEKLNKSNIDTKSLSGKQLLNLIKKIRTRERSKLHRFVLNKQKKWEKFNFNSYPHERAEIKQRMKLNLGIDISRVRHLVLDEADMLLTNSYYTDTRRILMTALHVRKRQISSGMSNLPRPSLVFPYHSLPMRIIMATATITPQMINISCNLRHMHLISGGNVTANKNSVVKNYENSAVALFDKSRFTKKVPVEESSTEDGDTVVNENTETLLQLVDNYLDFKYDHKTDTDPKNPYISIDTEQMKEIIDNYTKYGLLLLSPSARAILTQNRKRLLPSSLRHYYFVDRIPEFLYDAQWDFKSRLPPLVYGQEKRMEDEKRKEKQRQVDKERRQRKMGFLPYDRNAGKQSFLANDKKDSSHFSSINDVYLEKYGNLSNVSRETDNLVLYTKHQANILSKCFAAIAPRCLLVFLNNARHLEELAMALEAKNFKVGVINNSTHKKYRKQVFNQIHRGELNIVLTTNIGARGLDWSGINAIVNYGCPEDEFWYIHRAGRADRMKGKQQHNIVLTIVESTYATSKTGPAPPTDDQKFQTNVEYNINAINSKINNLVIQETPMGDVYSENWLYPPPPVPTSEWNVFKKIHSATLADIQPVSVVEGVVAECYSGRPILANWNRQREINEAHEMMISENQRLLRSTGLGESDVDSGIVGSSSGNESLKYDSDGYYKFNSESEQPSASELELDLDIDSDGNVIYNQVTYASGDVELDGVDPIDPDFHPNLDLESSDIDMEMDIDVDLEDGLEHSDIEADIDVDAIEESLSDMEGFDVQNVDFDSIDSEILSDDDCDLVLDIEFDHNDMDNSDSDFDTEPFVIPVQPKNTTTTTTNTTNTKTKTKAKKPSKTETDTNTNSTNTNTSSRTPLNIITSASAAVVRKNINSSTPTPDIFKTVDTPSPYNLFNQGWQADQPYFVDGRLDSEFSSIDEDKAVEVSQSNFIKKQGRKEDTEFEQKKNAKTTERDEVRKLENSWKQKYVAVRMADSGLNTNVYNEKPTNNSQRMRQRETIAKVRNAETAYQAEADHEWLKVKKNVLQAFHETKVKNSQIIKGMMSDERDVSNPIYVANNKVAGRSDDRGNKYGNNRDNRDNRTVDRNNRDSHDSRDNKFNKDHNVDKRQSTPFTNTSTNNITSTSTTTTTHKKQKPDFEDSIPILDSDIRTNMKKGKNATVYDQLKKGSSNTTLSEMDKQNLFGKNPIAVSMSDVNTGNKFDKSQKSEKPQKFEKIEKFEKYQKYEKPTSKTDDAPVKYRSIDVLRSLPAHELTPREQAWLKKNQGRPSNAVMQERYNTKDDYGILSGGVSTQAGYVKSLKSQSDVRGNAKGKGFKTPIIGTVDKHGKPFTFDDDEDFGEEYSGKSTFKIIKKVNSAATGTSTSTPASKDTTSIDDSTEKKGLTRRSGIRRSKL